MQEYFLTMQEILMDDMVARFSVHAADSFCSMVKIELISE